MLDISIRADIKGLTKKLDALAYKQLPYAQAQAVTALARRVQAGELDLLKQTFPTATPFTLHSVGMKPARKDDPTAIVFMKDIAAQYLEPFEKRGTHKLIGSGMTWLNPKDMSLLNQYGNFPRGALARLKGRPDVFVGAVKTKSGQVINGVWQRPFIRANQKTRGKTRASKRANTTGRLKLLIRFGDAIPVRQHLGWGSKAQATVSRWFGFEFKAAMAKAVASAR